MARRELVFSSAGDIGQVFTALSTRFTVHTGSPVLGRWTCLDTTDWRLHRAGLTLRDARSGRRAELVLANGKAEPLIVTSRVRSWPARVSALPPSAVRDRLTDPVGARALLPMAQVDVHSIPMTLLDELDKTRVRVRVDLQRLAGSGHHPLPLRVLISALRGYESDADRAVGLLVDSLPALDADEPAATIAMITAGHTPGRPVIERPLIDAQAPIARSLVAVLRYQAELAQAAVPGVLADLDPEYLHELRTSIRATRSVLRLGGHLLPTAQVARYEEQLAALADLTSPVRDLDVLMERLEGEDFAGIDPAPLWRQLRMRRGRALRTLQADLRSTDLLSRWRTTLDHADLPGAATGPHAVELAEVAHRKVAKAAKAGANAPAEELHRLRKRAKRMRYLLDGFADVYEPGAYKQVRKRLKALQRDLGVIQDGHVQERLLVDAAAALVTSGADVELLLTIGAIRERVRGREAQARERLGTALKKITGKQARAHVHALGSR